MANSKKLSDEENRARARRDSHKYRHKNNNISARVLNRAYRIAAKWVEEDHPRKWAAIKAQAWREEERNTTRYTPHSVRFGGQGCPHDKLIAVGITVMCAQCKEIIGSVPVNDQDNKDLLQDILEDEQ